jgi:methylenetetrahydrofolate reductase (NADPH)
MNKNVSGIVVPDEIVARLKNAQDQKKEGLKIAVETIEALKKMEGVAGVHIMAIAWEEVVPEIAESAGLLPRPTF